MPAPDGGLAAKGDQTVIANQRKDVRAPLVAPLGQLAKLGNGMLTHPASTPGVAIELNDLIAALAALRYLDEVSFLVPPARRADGGRADGGRDDGGRA